MYHYVRDLQYSRYPEIKGLDVELFKEQLAYISQHYTIIRVEELIAALTHGANLPSNAALLTFDDGYKDHFEYVFPLLDEHGLQGCFFPPAKAIQEQKVLGVNKIHFVLASAESPKHLIAEMFDLLDGLREEHSLKENAFYYEEVAEKGRFDSADVIFIKRMLQRELPEAVRTLVVDALFAKHVCADEGAFSRELYMSMDQLRLMARKGMYIGSHGYTHCWLDTVDSERQKKEVDLSLRFLQEVGVNTKEFVFCYPYGASNETLREVLRHRGCSFAVTTEVGVAELAPNKQYLLPRLDTNDLPKNANAEPNYWTKRVLQG